MGLEGRLLAPVSVGHPRGDAIHAEPCVEELTKYLLAHFEAVHRYAWSYRGGALVRLGAVLLLHKVDSFLYYAQQRSAPSSVYGCRCMVDRVVNHYWYAVGSAYAKYHTRQVGDDSIDALKEFLLTDSRLSEEGFVHLIYLVRVHLMGIEEGCLMCPKSCPNLLAVPAYGAVSGVSRYILA